MLFENPYNNEFIFNCFIKSNIIRIFLLFNQTNLEDIETFLVSHKNYAFLVFAYLKASSLKGFKNLESLDYLRKLK